MIKKIVYVIMCVWSKIYSLELSVWTRGKRNMLYTMWLQNRLGFFGNDSVIRYPAILEGCRYDFIRIGNRTKIDSHSVLGCWKQYGTETYEAELTIGDDCNIGEFFHVSAINKIKIGNGLLTGRYVYIGDNSHGGLSMEESEIPPAKRKLKSRGGIEIGNNVWIGDKTTILSGVTIGDNVIIGANSVVTHDIPSNCMAAGAPAKVVKHL